MLNYMEDQIKIFVAGFKKWAKMNKVNQITLGEIISRHQSSVSAYFKEEARPMPEMIEKWVKHFNLDYEEILQAGRQELSPPTDIDQQIEAKVDAKFKAYTAKLSGHTEPENDLQKYIHKKNKKHHELVDTFEQTEEAYEINCILKKIETLKKSKFKRIKKFLLDELEELQEGAGSSVPGEAPNGTGK